MDSVGEGRRNRIGDQELFPDPDTPVTTVSVPNSILAVDVFEVVGTCAR